MLSEDLVMLPLSALAWITKSAFTTFLGKDYFINWISDQITLSIMRGVA